MMFFRFFLLLALWVCQLSALERYPSIKPNCTGILQVDETHQIYWEESGNPNGVPVLFLHGGPGSGTEPSNRTFFDPNFYRIILFDQRGCGKSLPQGCLINNTTWDLVEDINQLRTFFSIDRWLLFGGSWGSTLALTYSIKYPEHVSGIILRGIFLSTQEELDWFYKDGANHLSPKAWQLFSSTIASEKQSDLIAAYHEELNSDSYWRQINAAAAWVLWEYVNVFSKPDPRLNAIVSSHILFYAFANLFASHNRIQATIENHYFFHKGFFETDNWILENMHRIQHIPGIIVQGQKDRICPWKHAEKLHQHWPASKLILVSNDGHASTEPGILQALLESTESFKTIDQ